MPKFKTLLKLRMKRHTFLISFCIHQKSPKLHFLQRLPTVVWGSFLEGGGLFFFFLNATLVTIELLHIHYVCCPQFTTSYLTELSLWRKDCCVKNGSVLLGEEVSASPQSAAALRTEVHDATIRILLEAALCPKVIQTGFYWASQHSLLSF